MLTKDFFQTKLFKGIIIGIAGTVCIMLIFFAGEAVGYRKASFSFHNGDNYYRAFEGGDRKGGNFFSGLPDANGAVGKVVQVSLPTIVVEDKDATEKTVLLNDKTIVRQFHNDIKSSDIAVGDYVVVVGQPNAQSQIEAVLVRMLPPPPPLPDTVTPTTISVPVTNPQ